MDGKVVVNTKTVWDKLEAAGLIAPPTVEEPDSDGDWFVFRDATLAGTSVAVPASMREDENEVGEASLFKVFSEFFEIDWPRVGDPPEYVIGLEAVWFGPANVDRLTVANAPA